MTTIATATNGKVYKVNEQTGKAKKVITSFDELPEILDGVMPMTVYQKYFKDMAPTEDCTIKKDRMIFRGYRISCDAVDGFKIEDTHAHYKLMETSFEGIPTPRELWDFFKREVKQMSADEIKKAVALGKEKVEEAKEVVEKMAEVVSEIDYGKLRKKVLDKVIKIQKGVDTDFDPLMFPEMIPFKRWKRKVNAALGEWKSKKIRYATLLKKIQVITEEESFEMTPRVQLPKFVGTLLPEFKTVGELKGNKIDVDGKFIDAVPFIRDCFLHYEPKAMYQMMRFAKQEITAQEFVQNPIVVNKNIEYEKGILENTEINARVLSAAMASAGVVPVQDILFTSELSVGDKILLMIGAEWKIKTVQDTSEGIVINKGEGLLKTDRWIKL